jgi:hypothetical protein
MTERPPAATLSIFALPAGSRRPIFAYLRGADDGRAQAARNVVVTEEMMRLLGAER